MTDPRSGEESALARLLEAARAGTLYGASLPERALRAMVGAAAGVLRESAQAAVPDAMKGSKLYELTVRKMLGFLIQDVGGLEGAGKELPAGGAAPSPAAPGAPAGAEYAAKKALGNAIDIAGIVALHVSPLWIIALLSDAVHGTRAYLHALGDELRRTGVIAPDSKLEGIDGLLEALQKVSGTVADSLDTPPVTAAELERMVKTLREESAKVDLRRAIPEEEIAALWNGIQEAARAEGRSPFEVSSALAMMAFGQIARAGKGAAGAVKVGFDLIGDDVIRYYLDGLAEMRAKGYYRCVLDAADPYIEGIRLLFEPSRESLTEKVLKGKPLRALWRKLKEKCSCRRPPGSPR